MDSCTGDLPTQDVVRVAMEPGAPHWTWLACHERMLHDAHTRYPGRTTWREPPISSHCCLPQRGCFRAVYDGRIHFERWRFNFTRGQKVHMRQSAIRSSPSAGWELGRVTGLEPLRVRLVSDAHRRGRAWDEVRPAADRKNGNDVVAPLAEDWHATKLAEEIRRLLVAEAGVRDSDVVASSAVRQATKVTGAFSEVHRWHYDYGQHPGAIFSAILYTGNDGEEPLVGGETAFVTTPPPPTGADDVWSDDHAGLQRLPNGSTHLRRGWVVSPRVGRLVLFTGGAENYHAPMPVLQGRRQTLQVWFRCACSPASKSSPAPGAQDSQAG